MDIETCQNNIVIDMLQSVLNKFSNFENQLSDLRKRIDRTDPPFNVSIAYVKDNNTIL